MLTICIVVSSGITVITILNLRVFYKKEDEKIPDWLRLIYKRYRACSVDVSKDKNSNSCQIKENSHSIHQERNLRLEKARVHPKVTDIDTDKRNRERETPNLEADNKHDDIVAVTWHDISSMIDTVSLIVTTTVIVLNFAVHLFVSRFSAK